MELKAFVEELKSRLDIVEVIGSYVSLQKVGKNYRALCPFHAEKTPSFYVNPERGFYHCFGCGASGDVIKFVQEIERLDFMEALSKLADRAGMVLPAFAGKDSAYEIYVRLHEALTEYYKTVLFSQRGKEATEYLTDVRKLTSEDIKDFEIGYAPSGADDEVRRYLEGKGVSIEYAIKYGLLQRSDVGYAHRFAGRVILPIRNESGRIVGFGGRLLGDGQPKYLNSRDSKYFKKSGLLYLFDRAKKAAKKAGFIAVVEGYFDAIALHKAGIKSAVASLTAALTPLHLSKIASVVENLLLVFDADEAGLKAAKGAFEEVVRRNLSVVVATLESGKDPDEVFRTYGPERLKEELLKAVPYEVFVALVETQGLDLDSTSGRETYLRKTTRWYQLLKESNPDRAKSFLNAVSERVGWSLKEVESFWKGRREVGTERVINASAPEKSRKDAEDFLVKLYITSHSLRREIARILEQYQEVLSDFGKVFYQAVKNRNFDLNFLASKLSKDMADRLFDDLDVEIAPGKEMEILEDCKRKLARKKLKAEIEALDEKLEDPSLSVQERTTLLSERIRLSKLLKGKG